MPGPQPRRSLVVWVPDWPVTAWRRAELSTSLDQLDQRGVSLPEPRAEVSRPSTGGVATGFDQLDQRAVDRPGGDQQGFERLAGPVAIMDAGRVLACSAAAQADGVAEGMRRREAQARCPGLVLVASDPGRSVEAAHEVHHQKSVIRRGCG